MTVCEVWVVSADGSGYGVDRWPGFMHTGPSVVGECDSDPVLSHRPTARLDGHCLSVVLTLFIIIFIIKFVIIEEFVMYLLHDKCRCLSEVSSSRSALIACMHFLVNRKLLLLLYYCYYCCCCCCCCCWQFDDVIIINVNLWQRKW